MKRALSHFFVFAMIVMFCSCGSHSHTEAQRFRVGLVYIGPHEVVNEIVAGFREGLAEKMPGQPVEIVERHANGDETQISSTINGALSSKLDLLAPITTPVSQQALKNAPRGLPVVFVGVTDPIGAGIVKSLDHPELCTGVSDVAPLSKILPMIKQITPSVKKIGFPYSPGEEPAMYSLRQVEEIGPALGYVIDARPVKTADELPSLIRDLVRSNDAILVGADNPLFLAAPTISKIALDGHKPFYSADSSSVKAGAVAGVTVDYRKVGRAGAELAARVLKGAKAGSIPVTMMSEGVLEVNETSLKKLGITLPAGLMNQVKSTYK